MSQAEPHTETMVCLLETASHELAVVGVAAEVVLEWAHEKWPELNIPFDQRSFSLQGAQGPAVEVRFVEHGPDHWTWTFKSEHLDRS